MTDTVKPDEEQEVKTPSERDMLKERADMMNIKYAGNISTDALRERVNAALTATPSVAATAVAAQGKGYEIKRKATALVRVRITCLNPSKRDSEGEFFRTGNKYVPTISRFVPFEQDTHIEQMLLTLIQNREYSIVVHEKNAEGRKSPVRKQRKEFQVEILEPLSKEELAKLAESQIKRNAI